MENGSSQEGSTWQRVKETFKSSEQKAAEEILAKPYEQVAIRPRTKEEDDLSNQDMPDTVRHLEGQDVGSTPFSNRKGMNALGDKMRETQAIANAQEAARDASGDQDEYKKAA